ncbi:Tfp pilus assembly protein PilF [Parelusimicrobium proximum]|uniref:tetratricopeptide repeat protein n=1 Tax=Parelusimicrobium proximum TaxID=3228953 RepID=UPI003D16F378
MRFKNIFYTLAVALSAVILPLSADAANIFGKKQREVNPDYTKTYWDRLMQQQSVFDVSRGFYAMQTAHYQDAAEAFAKAVVKNPSEPFTHIFYGMALYWTGEVDAAMNEYREAIKLNPALAESYQLLGIAYGWKGDTKNALKNFLQADKLDKRPDVKMNLSSVYSMLGDGEKALDYAREAVDLQPKSPLYHYHLGTILERRGQDAQAISSFERALKLFPQYQDSMLALGAIHQKRNEDDKAIAYFRRAVRAKPKDAVARLRYAGLLFDTYGSERAREEIAGALAISVNKNKGLALNLSYAGGGATASQSATAEEQKIKDALSALDPADDAQIEVEIVYSPLRRLESAKEKSLLESALEEPDEQKEEIMPRTFKRVFVLAGGDGAKRAAQIDSISSAIAEVMSSTPKDEKVSMSLNASSVDRAAPGSSRNSSDTSYNPRNVGNDMGLWVTGRSWIRYVEEVREELESRLDDGKKDESFLNILMGLTYLTLGEGRAAFDYFEKAEKNGERELGALGKGTAMIVTGMEKEALLYYKEALKINPKNKTAAANIAVLGESASKKEELK